MEKWICTAQSRVGDPDLFPESEAMSMNIAIVDFKFKIPQCMEYSIVRKLKENYDCIVDKSRTFHGREWYQKATMIEVQAIEVKKANERLIYYGNEVDEPERQIPLENYYDLVDKITISVDRTDGETVVSEQIELDFYIEAYTNTLTSLVFLTTKTDLKLKEGVDLLLSLVFEPFDTLPVDKYTFVAEAVYHLRGVFLEEKGESIRIVLESGIRNLILDSVPKNVLANIVVYDGEMDISLKSSPKRRLKNLEALLNRIYFSTQKVGKNLRRTLISLIVDDDIEAMGKEGELLNRSEMLSKILSGEGMHSYHLLTIEELFEEFVNREDLLGRLNLVREELEDIGYVLNSDGSDE